MSNGEWYVMIWWHWWESTDSEEAERIAYFHADQPPREWLDWAAHQVWKDMKFGAVGVRRFAEHGIGTVR